MVKIIDGELYHKPEYSSSTIFFKNGYPDRQVTVNMLNSYAEFNNFDLTRPRSKKDRIHFKRQKESTYHNTRANADEDKSSSRKLLEPGTLVFFRYHTVPK